MSSARPRVSPLRKGADEWLTKTKVPLPELRKLLAEVERTENVTEIPIGYLLLLIKGIIIRAN